MLQLICVRACFLHLKGFGNASRFWERLFTGLQAPVALKTEGSDILDIRAPAKAIQLEQETLTSTWRTVCSVNAVVAASRQQIEHSADGQHR